MDKEYIILNQIYKNETTTQRDIAVKAGISVGAVNLLIKKMVRKGFIKIERLNTKTLRYMLTPKGMHEKVRLTYMYAKSSYQRIIMISETVKNIVNDKSQRQLKEVILFGPEDEIREIIKMGLSGTESHYKSFEKLSDLKEYLESQNASFLILVWRTEEEELLSALKIDTTNVLDRVVANI